MQRNLPDNFEEASEEQKSIYLALDNLLQEDIIIYSDNTATLRFRLGNTILAESLVTCKVENNKVVIYANPKSD